MATLRFELLETGGRVRQLLTRLKLSFRPPASGCDEASES